MSVCVYIYIRVCTCMCVCGGQCSPCWQGYSRVSSHFALQEKEMEKQRLLYQQSRLHNRGAAEMVLQMISACKGSTRTLLSCAVTMMTQTKGRRQLHSQQQHADDLAKQNMHIALFQVNQEPWFLRLSNWESPSSTEVTVMCSR